MQFSKEVLYSQESLDVASPMIKQYLQIKAKHLDKILLFRMGDFYEFFFEDALEMARLLNLSVAYRNQTHMGQPIPMAGMPFHSADAYIVKLVEAGLSVAICEQVGNPKLKTLTERSVVKIITPGTLTEDQYLPQNESRPLVAVKCTLFSYSIALLDLSSGRFEISTFNSEREYLARLIQYNPAEIICIKGEITTNLIQNIGYIKELESSFFSYNLAEKNLKDIYSVSSFKKLDTRTYQDAISCAGAIIQYIEHTQKIIPKNFQELNLSLDNDLVILDKTSIRNLELLSSVSGDKSASLFATINRCNTSMGSRLLHTWLIQPIRNEKQIQRRLDVVEQIINANCFNDLSRVLSQLFDLERIISRLNLNNISPRDLGSLRTSLKVIPELNEVVASANLDIDEFFEFKEIVDYLDKSLNDKLPNYLRDGDVFRDDFTVELQKWRNLSKNARELLRDIEDRERRDTGIETLKIDYNDVHGFYINVPKGSVAKVPSHYIRRQTLKNAERYIIDELLTLEKEKNVAVTEILELERAYFLNLLNFISIYIKDLQKLSVDIARLDVLNSFAIQAFEFNYCRPNFNSENIISIKDGRHPVIEKFSDSPFINNDTELNQEQSLTIVTGPNMGGKSTYMRQTALITLLAHIGSFVPAKAANISIIDRLFTRIGANDDISSGLSTFMIEMTEMANILNNATQKSLLLVDEIGRGTSTYDGMSLAYASAIYIAKEIKALCLFATHYFEITNLENEISNVKNVHLEAIEHNGNISFLHKIKAGATSKSYGISVANLAGVPQKVLNIARNNLLLLEKRPTNEVLVDSNTMLELTQETTKQVENEKYQMLVKEVVDLDINAVTPYDALIFLHKLKDKLKDN